MQKFALLKKKNKNKKKNNISLVSFLGIPFYVITIGLVVIPLVLLVLYAFQANDESNVFFINFTLNNFTNFFKEGSFVKTMFESLYIAAISTVVTLLIGYPLAYLISRSKPKNQPIMILIVTSPMWINMLLRANALQQIFNMINPSLIGTNFAIIVGMVYIFLPFMVLPIYTVLSKLDMSLLDASADLGANKLQTILKIIVPLSLSGVLSGIMMVFLPAATTLVIPKYLGNNRYMIGNLIDNYIKTSNIGGGAAIALILAVIMMFFVSMIKKIDRNQGVNINEN